VKNKWKYAIIFERLDEEIRVQNEQIDISDSLKDTTEIQELSKIINELNAQKEILTFTRAS
jgi:hypothetical protein